MRNEKLRGVFMGLGFARVETVISSGNVLFDSPSEDVQRLEATIEKALPLQLGFTSATIIRSRERLRRLAGRVPFKGHEDVPNSRLNVTFLKRPPMTKLTFPYRTEDGNFELVALYDQAICSVTNLSRGGTPDVMAWLERQFGKEITTRTWRTVGRILRRMDAG